MASSVDNKRPCKATLVIGVVITEPTKDNTTGSEGWRPICVDNTSIGVNLDGYNHQDLSLQVKTKLEEFSKLWGNQLILLETSPVDVKPPQ